MTVDNQPPTAINQPLSTNHYQPTTINQQPSTNHYQLSTIFQIVKMSFTYGVWILIS
ncbi:MAG: hypothetical protein VKN72_19900 [Nostocales cyanobacterium 94392]|nr:hypothetical protein [Nostocales cyanobacterium 94392]